MHHYNIDGHAFEAARERVDRSQEFQKYFQLINTSAEDLDNLTESDPRWAGSLMPLLHYQRKSVGSPHVQAASVSRDRARRPSRVHAGELKSASPV
jgi:hypothetical protein